MWPPFIENSSFIDFSIGTIALVVHEAAEMRLSLSLIIESLIPLTIFLILPLAGAVNMTFDAPD